MSTQSTYVRVAPSPRIKDTQTPASADLVQLRVKHLLPTTTHRARERVAKLKKLFTVPTEMLLREQAAAHTDTLQRLRLVKSVRNIKVQNGSSASTAGPTSVAGTLCLPFHSCAALPVLSAAASSTPLAAVLTGSVDGLLTLWDAEHCTPLCSQSTYAGGRGWGRVKSVAVYPSSIGGAAVAQCFAFTASMFQREVQVWRIRATEGDAPCAAPTSSSSTSLSPDVSSQSGATLEPLTTAPCNPLAAESNDTNITRNNNNDNVSTAVGGLQQLAVDPTGALLAATHRSGLVHVWDARSVIDGFSTSSSSSSTPSSSPLVQLYTQDGYETAAATLGLTFHPDGSLLTTSDAGGRVVAWDTRSGQLAFHTGGRVGNHLAAALCVAWSPCGVRLASGGADGVVHLYDARKLSKSGLGPHKDGSAAPFQLFGHDDAVTSVSFYANPMAPPDSARSVLPIGVVTTSLDHTMRVWDADTGLCVRALDAAMPLYDHCRPALEPLSRQAAVSSAVMAVGHGKTWLLYDVGLRGEESDDVTAAVEVTENAIVASTHDGAAGGMKFSVITAAEEDADQKGSSSDDEEDDEEEEYEMMALRRAKVAPSSAVAAVTGSRTAEEDDASDSEESSEDEMEKLKKK